MRMGFASPAQCSTRERQRQPNPYNQYDVQLRHETDLREILSGERKSGKMNEEMKETVEKIAEYSAEEKEKRRKKLNRYFILGEIFILLVILDHQFGILSKIFVSPIDDFAAGALIGLSLLFNFIGFYDNSHEVSLRKRKRELFLKKGS